MAFSTCFLTLWRMLHRKLLGFKDSDDMSYFTTFAFPVISNREGAPPCFSPGDPWVQPQVGGLVGCQGSRGDRAGREDGCQASASLTATCLSGLPTVVKLVDRDTLLKEREEKKKVSRKTK